MQHAQEVWRQIGDHIGANGYWAQSHLKTVDFVGEATVQFDEGG